jgi:hypothetical protein
LLPDIPRINANASGMMGQTRVAGAGFASPAGVAVDHAATQALLHANGTSSGTG